MLELTTNGDYNNISDNRREMRMNMSPQINELATALSLAQGELDSAKKMNSGYGYNYSDLATVIATTKDVLSKNGLSVSQLAAQPSRENHVALTSILMHKSGQYIASTAEIPTVEMKGCNEAQRIGATLSYLRRYMYQSLVGQPSEDNDASSSGFVKERAESPKVAQEAPSAPSAPRKGLSFRRQAAESKGEHSI